MNLPTRCFVNCVRDMDEGKKAAVDEQKEAKARDVSSKSAGMIY